MNIDDRPDPQFGDMAHIHSYPVDHNMDGGDSALGCVFIALVAVLIIAGVAWAMVRG